jgi:hypothetical protein
MKPRDWRDLVRAIYDPADIEELIRAADVSNLLAMASQPGMPSEPFHVLATTIAADESRSDRERTAARRALRSQVRDEEQARRAVEKARAKAEFDALPMAPPLPTLDEVDDQLNPFVDIQEST